MFGRIDALQVLSGTSRLSENGERTKTNVETPFQHLLLFDVHDSTWKKNDNETYHLLAEPYGRKGRPGWMEGLLRMRIQCRHGNNGALAPGRTKLCMLHARACMRRLS